MPRGDSLIQVEFNEREVRALTNQFNLSPAAIQTAMFRAVNDTLISARQVIVQKVRERFKIKAKVIRELVRLRKARKGPSPGGAVTLSATSRIPLRDFGARQTKRGVSYEIETGRRTLIPGAFILDTALLGAGADQASEHVFVRAEGAGRLPIRKRYGLSPWGAYHAAGAGPAVRKRVEERLSQALKQRVDGIVARMNARRL